MAEVMDKGELRQTFSENGAFAPLSEMPLPTTLADAIRQEIDAIQQKAALEDEHTALGKVHEKAKQDSFKQHQLTVRGKAEDSNLIESNAVNEASDNPRTKKGREKEKKKFDRLMRKLIRGMENWSVEDHFRELDKFRAWLNARADELEKQAGKLIEEYSPKMQANSEFISEADTILEAHKNDQPVNLEDVRKLLKKRGIEVDEDVPLVVLLEKLEQARNEVEQENKAYENEINALINQADEYRTQAEKIHTAAEKIKDDLKHGRITKEEARRQLKELWKDVPEKIKDEYEQEYGLSAMVQAEQDALERQLAGEGPPSKLDQNKGTLAREFYDKANGEVREEALVQSRPVKVTEYDPFA